MKRRDRKLGLGSLGLGPNYIYVAFGPFLRYLAFFFDFFNLNLGLVGFGLDVGPWVQLMHDKSPFGLNRRFMHRK